MSEKGVSDKRGTKAEQTARNAGVCQLGDALKMRRSGE